MGRSLPLLLATLVLAGACHDTGAPPPSEDRADECRDEQDNDGDGQTDCDDDGCALFVFCAAAPDAVGGDAVGGDARGGDARGGGDDADAGRDDAGAPPCQPKCNGRSCGPDGCGGRCGRCGTGETCRFGRCDTLGCGPSSPDVYGRLVTEAGAVEFTAGDLTLRHRSSATDGCPAAAELLLWDAGDCWLLVSVGDRVTWDGRLAVQDVTLTATGTCSAFAADAHGVYRAVSTHAPGALTIRPADPIPLDDPAPCVPLEARLDLHALLRREADGVPLTVSAEDVELRGAFHSRREYEAACPCQPECAAMDGADDGCGGCCGPCTTPALLLDPPLVTFGARTVGETATRPVRLLSVGSGPVVIRDIGLAVGVAGNFSLETSTLPGGGAPISAADPLELPPAGHAMVRVRYTPDHVNAVDPTTGTPRWDSDVLFVDANVADEPLQVPVRGLGALHGCPTAAIDVAEGTTVRVGTLLHLDGTRSRAVEGPIVSWAWRVEVPEGAAGALDPSTADRHPTFLPDVEGVYSFQLEVWDGAGIRSCEPARVDVEVLPARHDIEVELRWRTPGDPDPYDSGPFAGADLDLHFLHPSGPLSPTAPDVDGDGAPDPYFDIPYDCFWSNPWPSWGAPFEAADDPRLVRDDIDGRGAEVIWLDAPEPGRTYQIAVHAWSDNGHGPSLATVRVHDRNGLVWEDQDVALREHDLWCVAYVDWPSGRVWPCEAPGGGRQITHGYQHPWYTR